MRLAALIFFALISQTAFAQQQIVMTGETVYKAIQCDVGRFAASGGKGLDPKMKAHIKYTLTEEKVTKFSISAKLGEVLKGIVEGPGVEASHNRDVTDGDTTEDDFNVHELNKGACFKNHPDVNVFKCLDGAKSRLRSKAAKVTCTHKVVIEGKFSASGKVIIWFINVGPGFDADEKLTFDISVVVPAKEDDKKKKPDES
jgi:hypothetical protein